MCLLVIKLLSLAFSSLSVLLPLRLVWESAHGIFPLSAGSLLALPIGGAGWRLEGLGVGRDTLFLVLLALPSSIISLSRISVSVFDSSLLISNTIRSSLMCTPLPRDPSTCQLQPLFKGLDPSPMRPLLKASSFLIFFLICHDLFFKNLFTYFYFWLHWVFVPAHGVASGGYSLLQCACFLLQWLFLLWSTGSRRAGFSSCSSRAVEHRLSSCGTWA